MAEQLCRTRQEIFDEAIVGLIRQGRAAYRTGGSSPSCVYRTRGGKFRCGIGMLIPDELYSKDFEHRTPATCEALANAARISDCDRNFADRVQVLHDDNISEHSELGHRKALPAKKFLERLYSAARQFAAVERLSFTNVEQAWSERNG